MLKKPHPEVYTLIPLDAIPEKVKQHKLDQRLPGAGLVGLAANAVKELLGGSEGLFCVSVVVVVTNLYVYQNS